MASRWNHGWFDVHPRYSAGSPAMVDMQTALGVARDEQQMFPGALEGVFGAEERRAAQTLGLGGIVEWKMESGASSILAYDLLTRTWHLYHATDVTGEYVGCDSGLTHLTVSKPRGSGSKYLMLECHATERPVLSTAPDQGRWIPWVPQQDMLLRALVRPDELAPLLSRGRYRKAAPERAQRAHQDIQRMLDEALEDAGVPRV
jgi:hypothetical protein